MSVTDRESGQVTCCSDIGPDPALIHPDGPARPASAGPPHGLTAGLEESLGRVAALAAAALSTPNAAVILAGTRALHGLAGAPGTRDRPTPCEQLLCADLVGSGDSLIMFSDGVTEARSDYGTARDLYGDERLGRLVARLGDMTAVAIADAIQLAALTFSGGRLRDDTVALVMKVLA